MSILVSMSGSRNVWMDNTTANLIGNDCLGIEINNGYNISLTSTMLTSVGIDVDLLRVKDTAFFSMNENRLDATGNGSTAAIFEDGTIFSTFNNYISISGTGSTGTMINGAIAHLEMDRTSVQGSEVTGYSSMDSMINASHLTIEVPGMVSTAWRSIDDNTLGMEHSIIDVTGTDSSGLIMSSILDKVELRSVVVTGDDDTFMTMSTNGGVVRMVDTTINSSSFTPAVSGTGTIFHIHNSSILGAESSVFLEDSPLSTVEDSYLGSIRTFVILNSTLTIDRSEMNYTLHSLDCMNRAFVKVIDSDGIGPNLDPSSDVEVWNRIDVRTVDRFGGSLRDVDIEMKNWDRMVYSTDRFSPGSTDPKTDIYGYIEKIPLLHSHYNGSNTPTLGETAIKVYLKGTAPSDWSESFTANTSYPHTELLTSPDIDRPMVPLNLSVSPLPNDEIAFLKWNLSDDDTTHYRIYERPLGSGSARLAAEVPATTATWTSGDLGPSNRIAYWLTGWDGTWESGPSSIEVVLTNDLSSPLAPSAVFKGNVTGDSITLKWTHAGDSDLAGFSIYMNSTPSHMEFSEVLSGDPDTREVLVSDLVWGTYYSFRISAFDTSNNWSPFTETDRIRT
ncbi:MAG: fibronectin type III domain-containing protein, partial [Candidatus Thermoplasmatota archaeon]|nr:fibronectin type III domain-containing protein [Candidatus Thermoplasmatota archaeon]